jgi:hypothetical protein
VLFFAFVLRTAAFFAAPLEAARFGELLLVRAVDDLFAAFLLALRFLAAVVRALAFFTDPVPLLFFAGAVRALATLRALAARDVALATR